MLEIDRVLVVGRDEATAVYTMLGGAEHASTTEFRELQRLHDRFLAHYRSRQFADAEEDLGLLEKIAPASLGGVYTEYRGRVKGWLATPPPPDWDGSYRAEHK